MPLLRQGGCLLAMKGPSVDEELDTGSDALMLLGAGELQVYDAYPEGFELNTVMVRVEKDRPTPPEYPREPGIAKRSPL